MPEPTRRGVIVAGRLDAAGGCVFRTLANLMGEANRCKRVFGCEAVDITGPNLHHYIDPEQLNSGKAYLATLIGFINQLGVKVCLDLGRSFIHEPEDESDPYLELVKNALANKADRVVIPAEYMGTEIEKAADFKASWSIRHGLGMVSEPGSAVPIVPAMVEAWIGPHPDGYVNSLNQVLPWLYAMEADGCKVVLRDFPMCVAETLQGRVMNLPQEQYNPVGRGLEVVNGLTPRQLGKDDIPGIRRKICDKVMEARTNEKCTKCTIRKVCLGPPTEHIKVWGPKILDDLKPVRNHGAPEDWEPFKVDLSLVP